jgi:hypothetical protein
MAHLVVGLEPVPIEHLLAMAISTESGRVVQLIMLKKGVPSCVMKVITWLDK